MTDWGDSTEPRTWGGLVAHAREFGVTVEELSPEVPFPDGEARRIRFLQRVDKGELLRYPLPHECTPDRRVGPLRFLQVCARLKIPDPSWPIEM